MLVVLSMVFPFCGRYFESTSVTIWPWRQRPVWDSHVCTLNNLCFVIITEGIWISPLSKKKKVSGPMITKSISALQRGTLKY